MLENNTATLDTNKDIMLFLEGSKVSFRCECGANVFKHIGCYKYKCNGCGLTYTGEPIEESSKLPLDKTK